MTFVAGMLFLIIGAALLWWALHNGLMEGDNWVAAVCGAIFLLIGLRLITMKEESAGGLGYRYGEEVRRPNRVGRRDKWRRRRRRP